MADIDTHKQDVNKYAKKVDTELVDALAKTYRLVLSNRDSAYVACSQPAELETIRKNFLKKKLGLSLPDEDLNAALKEVCAEMSDTKNKSRLTFYYLLAEKFGGKDALV